MTELYELRPTIKLLNGNNKKLSELSIVMFFSSVLLLFVFKIVWRFFESQRKNGGCNLIRAKTKGRLRQTG